MVFFVTGTDTDIGKSVVSALLTLGLSKNSQHIHKNKHIKKIIYCKLVQTGCYHQDQNFVEKICKNSSKNINFKTLYQFADPVSVDQAYNPNYLSIDQIPSVENLSKDILTFYQKNITNNNAKNTSYGYEYIVCEGAGGLMVPLNRSNQNWLDLIKALNNLIDIFVIVVARSGLGTLNHSILTLNALLDSAINLNQIALVLNGDLHKKNINSLKRIYQDLAIYNLTTLKDLDSYTNSNTSNKTSNNNNKAIADKIFCESKLLTNYILAKQIDYFNDSSNDHLISMNYDKQHCWHPYTQHYFLDYINKPLSVRSADKEYLYLYQNTNTKTNKLANTKAIAIDKNIDFIQTKYQKVYDGISSWWVSILGHAHPRLTRAIVSQHQKIDHVIYGGLNHHPASHLAAELIKLTNTCHHNQFSKVFFSDNGSTSVEIALKMSYSFSKKTRQLSKSGYFVSIAGCYHGDTMAAMSVAAKSGYHDNYQSLLWHSKYLKAIYNHEYISFDADDKCQKKIIGIKSKNDKDKILKDQIDFLQKNHQNIYGFIAEPLIQGAKGMLIYDMHWFNKLLKAIKKLKIPIIFDEVFTGFGRLGATFAMDLLKTPADIICLSKALSSAAFPISATITTQKIYQSFYSPNINDSLMHGHTFCGNPMGCAVALEVIAIAKKDNLFSRANNLHNYFQGFIKILKTKYSDSCLAPRSMGSILAFDFIPNKSNNHIPQSYPSPASKLADICLANGLFIRPLTNCVYLVIPLNISKNSINRMLEILKKSINMYFELYH